MADFENGLISRIFCVFWSGFLAQRNNNVVVESFFSCFLHFEFLTKNDQSCKGYSLCKMADFENGLISRIFYVFWNGFLHRPTIMLL